MTEDAKGQVPRPSVGRRRFVQALAGEAIGTAERLAGLSGMVHGSVVAAGQAFTDGFTTLAEPPTSASAGSPAARKPVRVAERSPVVAELTPASSAALTSARRVVVATNQSDGGPHVTISPMLFDGSTIRIPGRSMTARVANLQRDPRVSLAVLDDVTGATYLVAGWTELVYGDEAEVGCRGVYEATGATRSASSGPADLAVLIVVHPERVIRRDADHDAVRSAPEAQV